MDLFHYHWWTDKVEEMEEFYKKYGFNVTLRVGKYKEKLEAFNPPLNWSDFRQKEITFRIIEMIKGQTNITFGYGKRDILDHFGFLVNSAEYEQIIERAKKMKWRVNEDERRTFVSTPWKLKIELQKRRDVITEEHHTSISQMEIHLPFNHVNPSLIGKLLGKHIILHDEKMARIGNHNWSILFRDCKDIRLQSVSFLYDTFSNEVDPVNTSLFGNESD